MEFKTARTMFISPFPGDNILDFDKLKKAIKNKYGKDLDLKEIKVHWNKPVAYSRCAEQYVQLTENSEAILRYCKYIA